MQYRAITNGFEWYKGLLPDVLTCERYTHLGAHAFLGILISNASDHTWVMNGGYTNGQFDVEFNNKTRPGEVPWQHRQEPGQYFVVVVYNIQ